MAEKPQERPRKHGSDSHITLSFDRATLEILKSIAAGFIDNARQLNRIERNLGTVLKNEESIMANISDTHKTVKEGFDSSKASLANLGADIARLDAKIVELQNSPGVISPEDQALLDDILSMSADLKAQTQSLADAHPDPAVDPEVPPSSSRR